MYSEIAPSVKYVIVTGTTETLRFVVERWNLVDVGSVVGNTGGIIVGIGDERHCFRWGLINDCLSVTDVILFENIIFQIKSVQFS